MLMSRLATLVNVSVDQLNGQLQRYRRKTSEYSRKSEGKQENLKGGVKVPVSETPVQAAFKDLLEILICESGYISSVSEVLKPEDFDPETYRKIAASLWRCHEHLGEFRVAELLGTVEEAELADIITQLYKEGSRKGNFAVTLEDAMRCIQDYQREQEAARIAASLGQNLTEEETDRQLQALYENLQQPIRRNPGALVD
jgi:hypothetical protein